MTSAHVRDFPQQISIQVVLAAYTEGGSDYDPRLYIVAEGRRRENESAPSSAPGIGRTSRVHPSSSGSSPSPYHCEWDRPACTPSACTTAQTRQETEHLFPLPVAKFNPLLPPS